MKYVLMFTSRADLDAAIDPEAMKADYEKIYEWFEDNAAGHRRRRRRAPRRRDGDHGQARADGPVVVDGPFNEAKEIVGGFSDHRRPRHGRRIALTKSWPSLEFPGTRSRSGRWSRTTRSSSDATEAADAEDPPRADPARGGRSAGGLLSRRFGDFDLAEEAVQSAVVEALTTWRRDGPPENAGGLAAGRRASATPWTRYVGAATARALAAQRLAGLADRARSGTDDRLALLFACCHPALAPEARLALTLRAVVGLTTPQIARAFLVHETTLAQRIVRAKRKIVTAGIASTVPPPEGADGPARRRAGGGLRHVQRGLRLLDRRRPRTGTSPRTRSGSPASSATALPRRGRGVGAGRAAHHPARPRPRAVRRARRAGAAAATRTARRWDHDAIAEGERRLERAALSGPPGPLPAPAAIAAVHATAPSWEETDWLQIVTLYELLRATTRRPSSASTGRSRRAQLGRAGRGALAERRGAGRAAGGYHLFHATRAELLDRGGSRRRGRARPTERRSSLTSNDAERRLLPTRLHRHPLSDGS